MNSLRASLACIALLLALVGCGSSQPESHRAAAKAKVANPAPTQQKAQEATVAIPRGSGALAVMAPLRGLTLRSHPNGKVVAHLRPITAWGSPTVVWAVKRKGPWLGVIATSLGNNQVGWVDIRHDRPRMWRSRLSLRADLSDRELLLLRGSKVIRRMPVAIGSPATPTPTGRFSLTDKLIPGREVSYYGCCLLALSGHQPNLRPGWAGGDRIAIHGGPSIGTAASAGCLHARDSDLKRLMKLLPIGTPVVIQA